ncbi:hypothetical protein OC834_006962, partial [Tilletia horrida]
MKIRGLIFLKRGILAVTLLATVAYAGSISRRHDPAFLARAGGGQRPGQACVSNVDCQVTVCVQSTTCALLPLGGSRCAANTECAQGQCSDGVCSQVADGEFCGLNNQCQSGLCNTSDKCMTATTGSLHGLDICLDDSQCFTGHCSLAVDSNPFCHGYGPTCENVSRCTTNDVGGACGTSADCTMGLCESGTCTLTPVGGRCFQNGPNTQCSSGLCVYGECVPVNGGDACRVAGDCISGSCDSGTCALAATGASCTTDRDCNGRCDTNSNTCLAAEGSACSTGSACASGVCQGGICSLRASNAVCTEDGQCASGTCGPAANTCASFQLCADVRRCLPSADSAGCVTDGDCSSGSWCSGSQPGTSTGICAQGSRPPMKPVRPGQVCTSDFRPGCEVTACSTTPTCDSNGVCDNRCELLPLGSKLCISDTECAQGQCVQGVCALVPDGTYCGLNSQCSGGICNLAGQCSTPMPGSLPASEICTSDSQCVTGQCRPGAFGSTFCHQYGSSGQTCEEVRYCSQTALGGSCLSARDCSTGGCQGGICTLMPPGSSCRNGFECRSGYCSLNTCVLLSGGDFCVDSGDCATQCLIKPGSSNGTCAINSGGGTWIRLQLALRLRVRRMREWVLLVAHLWDAVPVGLAVPLAIMQSTEADLSESPALLHPANRAWHEDGRLHSGPSPRLAVLVLIFIEHLEHTVHNDAINDVERHIYTSTALHIADRPSFNVQGFIHQRSLYDDGIDNLDRLRRYHLVFQAPHSHCRLFLNLSERQLLFLCNISLLNRLVPKARLDFICDDDEHDDEACGLEQYSEHIGIDWFHFDQAYGARHQLCCGDYKLSDDHIFVDDVRSVVDRDFVKAFEHCWQQQCELHQVYHGSLHEFGILFEQKHDADFHYHSDLIEDCDFDHVDNKRKAGELELRHEHNQQVECVKHEYEHKVDIHYKCQHEADFHVEVNVGYQYEAYQLEHREHGHEHQAGQYYDNDQLEAHCDLDDIQAYEHHRLDHVQVDQRDIDDGQVYFHLCLNKLEADDVKHD